MTQTEKTVRTAGLCAVLVAATFAVTHMAGIRPMKQELENYQYYAQICDKFITDYIGAVHNLKDDIFRDDSTDIVIRRIDSLAFDFCGRSDLLEYNIYALDRDLYWDKVNE